MKIICKYNDPEKVSDNIPDNFDYGLELGKEYFVMGILTFKDSDNLYFLTDSNSKPSWFPSQIFEISNNKLSDSFSVRINLEDDNVDYRNLIGFDELCNDNEYFNLLLLRDEEAMRIYFKRKFELINNYN